jgi:MFS family permease
MPPAPTAQYHYDRKHIVYGLAAIFLVYGTMAYFIQSLSIARPRMAADLNGMSLYSWSVCAFVTLIFGKFSDMYGRRVMLVISVIFALLGSVLSAFSPNFVLLIAASSIGALGTGAMMPLVFAVVGDMFPPVERSKWIGLLQIPMGIAALLGPSLGGWFADSLGWRYVFWSTVPLLTLCLILVPIGIPPLASRGVKRNIDVRGSILMTLASSTAIIGISLAGVNYPWASVQIIGLLCISLIFWILFFRTEHGVGEPILDPLVLRNRSFNTVAAASFLSFFGQMAMMMYFPMFMQGVQEISATRSGLIFTPYSVLMAFIGVPAGFVLAKWRRYKWMYIVGFGILTADMFGVIFLTQETPVLWSFKMPSPNVFWVPQWALCFSA